MLSVITLSSCSGGASGVTRSAAKPVTRSMPRAESSRSETIAAAVRDIYGVEAAYAAITGATCVVAVALADETDERYVRREIEKTVKSADDKIDYVAITFSEEMLRRIAEHSR